MAAMYPPKNSSLIDLLPPINQGRTQTLHQRSRSDYAFGFSGSYDSSSRKGSLPESFRRRLEPEIRVGEQVGIGGYSHSFFS